MVTNGTGKGSSNHLQTQRNLSSFPYFSKGPFHSRPIKCSHAPPGPLNLTAPRDANRCSTRNKLSPACFETVKQESLF